MKTKYIEYKHKNTTSNYKSHIQITVFYSIHKMLQIIFVIKILKIVFEERMRSNNGKV